jgi:hypothetical protein
MNESASQTVTLASPPEQNSVLRWLVEHDPKRWLLPVTGLWILGLDWLLFPEDVMTFGLVTPLIGFLLGGWGTYQLQRRFAGDDTKPAAAKAILAGLVVGVPFALAGTVVGAWILVASGLSTLRDRLTGTLLRH